jgi:cytochrome c-type biogenesis protein CcmH
MVEGLSARLESQGGTAEEWARLVRSFVVLGEADRARSALAKARQALPPGSDGEQLDGLARELQLEARVRQP